MIKNLIKIKKIFKLNKNYSLPRKKQLKDLDLFKNFLNLARSEMDKYGLCDWKLELDYAKVRAGACHFTEKKISFSTHFLKNADQLNINDTILHEIAHALVGPKHGHNRVWKNMAKKIGCSAKRCHTLEFSEYKWIRFCTNYCWEQKVHRRKLNLICKKCGSPVKYQQNI